MNASNVVIRGARAQDAAGCLAIYRPFVTDSWVSFEAEPPTTQQMAARIASANERHSWLVAYCENQLAGYAYGTMHRARYGYRFSTETSVYVADGFQGKGVARKLYRELFDALRRLGYFHAFAGITCPNDRSEAFHRAAGFEPIGVFPNVGFKLGQWRDVSWWYRLLSSGKPTQP